MLFQYRNLAWGPTLELKLHLDTKLKTKNEIELLHGVSTPHPPKNDPSGDIQVRRAGSALCSSQTLYPLRASTFLISKMGMILTA